jgi:hypothetical protein
MTTAVTLRSQNGVSANGWSANDRSVIATYTVPGTTLKIALRKGDVSVILLDFLARYHREVESLYHSPQDLWGYAERAIRGSSTTLSNHASGTAADHRAVDHPLGVRGTFTATELHALNRILAFYEGVLRHGKDYTGRPDEMHVEINAGAGAVKRIADKIRAGVAPTISPVPPNPVENSVALNQTQDDRLRVLVEQMVTGPNPAGWGWDAWPGGSVKTDGKPDRFTVVDFLRKQNQRAEDTMRALNDLRARVDGLASGRPVSVAAPPVALSDADVARIRDAVVPAVLDELSKRTAS